MKKRMVSGLCLVSMLLGLLAGCTLHKDGPTPDENYAALPALSLSAITYSESKNPQQINNSDIMVVLPENPRTTTGAQFVVRTKIQSNYVYPYASMYVYYVVDWGDGTWSYQGPFGQSQDYQVVVDHRHSYKQPGSYEIQVAAFPLSYDEIIGWSKPVTVEVTGSAYEHAGMITKVTAISSGAESQDRGASNILDGDSATEFVSAYAPTDDVDAMKYVGLMFDKNYALDKLEIQVPESAEVFPSNISIEYTTDHGKTWTFLPKYYYLYDYEVGRFDPIMNFPNPKGATLVLDMDGICANGVRLTSKLWPVYGADRDKERRLCVSEMRAYGSQEMLFSSSAEDTINAEINNMWTVYGTAKSEPRTLSSIYGELPNHSPFRAGFPMIGVTEWLDWQSQKFIWTGYEEANAAMVDVIKEVKYSGDSWSGEQGYIWSTSDNPKHFGVQSHYQYNAIFIMGVANYILSGNFRKLYDINNNEIDFFELKNRDGQTIWDRLEKAMNYQLVALQGNTGLLTINDPENAGRLNSNASSYYDAYNWDGYLSAACNIYFYASLHAMADLYDFRAAYYHDAQAVEKAAYLRDLSVTVKEKFNRTFWDSAKGRFIGAINVDGVRHDYGTTYINLMACAVGMVDDDKAKSLFEWINGEQIVEGDKSTGEDIYFYKIAPRSNTVDLSSIGPPYYFWDHDGTTMPTPDGWCGWPNQMNGGIFFWVEHYDLLARMNYLGSNDAWERFSVVIEEFRKDQLRRMSFYNDADKFDQGIIGEYPESGMVPLTFLNGFIGVNVDGDGLKISPSLPDALTFAKVNAYQFGGRTYSITVSKEIETPTVGKEGNKYVVCLPAEETYVITLDNRLIKLDQ